MSDKKQSAALPRPAEEDVRDIGRRARESRQEIASKRREIVQLNINPVVEKKKRKGASMIPGVRKKRARPNLKSKSAPIKRKSNSSSSNPRKRLASKTRVDVDNNDKGVDRRIPDISHLEYNEDTEDISNTVRVHGLPVGTKRGDLLRFFRGLDPAQIFVLPQNEAHIIEWDAEENEMGHKLILERHPGNMRVFVRFASAPVASLAAQRSGEEIYVRTDNSNDVQRGAMIAISQVLKATATYLSQYMAVECKANVPLQDTLTEVEKEVHEIVPKILWSVASHDLGFVVSRETRRQWLKDLCYQPLASFHKTASSETQTSLATDSEGYTALAKIHNLLLRDYESLISTKRGGAPSFPSVVLCECPTMLENSTTRLTDNAAKLLLTKSEQIADYLQMARSIASRCQQPQSPPRTASVFDRLIKRYSRKVDESSTAPA